MININEKESQVEKSKKKKILRLNGGQYKKVYIIIFGDGKARWPLGLQ